MSISGLLNKGLSGLVASQRGLATAGHNISNVNTPGYHRQRAELVARPPQGSRAGFIGKGVAVDTVRRSYDQFLTAQVRTTTAGSSEAQSFHELASRVDNLLANSDTGLASTLQRFFDAVHEVAADPASLPSRQVLLSEAEGLAQRYHALSKQVTDLERETSDRLTSLVSEVNALSEGIAELNGKIVEAEGASGGQPANDLRDRRDELLRQLSGQVGFHTVTQDDGSINVLVGNGPPLVVGSSSLSLAVVDNPFDATRKEVGVSAGGSTTIISGMTSGGAIGGLLDFRDDVLAETKSALGRIAVGLVSRFNGQHQLGSDLDGNAGLSFFVPIETLSGEVLGHEQNAGPRPSVTVTDPAALTISDYRLDYDGTEYVVTRLSDNKVDRFTAPVPTIAVDGFAIDLSVPPTAGDSFIIRPVSAGAKEFDVALQDPRLVAAAFPDVNGGVGDNRNALQLAGLQEVLSLENGSATFAGAYGQLVASVGTTTQKAEARRSAQDVLLNQVTDAQDAVSGVNLDEEAADLLRYQQAYEASARFIAAADSTFRTLLDAVGR